jgi:hypothetical protein
MVTRVPFEAGAFDYVIAGTLVARVNARCDADR